METLTSYSDKPAKKNKLKIFLIGILIVVSLFGVISYSEYTKELEKQGVNLPPQENKQNQNYKEEDLDGLANERMKIRNSTGYEVIGLDHNGSITGIGNLTYNYSTGGYGYFRYLGDSVNRITNGFFTNLNVLFNVNATNVSAEEFCNSTGCYTVTDFLEKTVDTTIGNCSVTQSCGDVAYTDQEETFQEVIVNQSLVITHNATVNLTITVNETVIRFAPQK